VFRVMWRSRRQPVLADHVLASLPPLPTLPGARSSENRPGQQVYNVVMVGPNLATDTLLGSDARVSIHVVRLNVHGFHDWLKTKIYGEYSVLGFLRNAAGSLIKVGATSEVSRPRLFFVDESSLASASQMHQLVAASSSQDRIIRIGDTQQHQSVVSLVCDLSGPIHT
jgi:hypothetical protein